MKDNKHVIALAILGASFLIGAGIMGYGYFD